MRERKCESVSVIEKKMGQNVSVSLSHLSLSLKDPTESFEIRGREKRETTLIHPGTLHIHCVQTTSRSENTRWDSTCTHIFFSFNKGGYITEYRKTTINRCILLIKVGKVETASDPEVSAGSEAGQKLRKGL